jgi:hypothetical protein
LNHRILAFKTSRLVAAAALAAVLVAAGTSLRSAAAWRDAPDYVLRVAPPAHRAAYRAFVSPSSLEVVIAALADDASLVRVPGAWTPRTETPLDAFGRSGPYNRWELVWVYGSRQPRVARGARMENGRVIESWTLISPYPTPDLAALEPGTLIITLRVP